jgi:hypothetical protein
MISACGVRRPKVILLLILIVGKTAWEGDLMAKEKFPEKICVPSRREDESWLSGDGT